MSRAELADAVSQTPSARRADLACDDKRVAEWENGQSRWPRPKYRLALHELTGRDPRDPGIHPAAIPCCIPFPKTRPASQPTPAPAAARAGTTWCPHLSTGGNRSGLQTAAQPVLAACLWQGTLRGLRSRRWRGSPARAAGSCLGHPAPCRRHTSKAGWQCHGWSQVHEHLAPQQHPGPVRPACTPPGASVPAPRIDGRAASTFSSAREQRLAARPRRHAPGPGPSRRRGTLRSRSVPRRRLAVEIRYD
jgi:hypothetical protein